MKGIVDLCYENDINIKVYNYASKYGSICEFVFTKRVGEDVRCYSQTIEAETLYLMTKEAVDTFEKYLCEDVERRLLGDG